MGKLSRNVNKLFLNRFGVQIIRYKSPAIVNILNHFQFDTVIDVGANIGQFAKSLLDFQFQGRIFSIEPSLDAFNELHFASKRHRQWHIMPRCALGSSEREVKLNISENSYSSSILEVLPTHTRAEPKSKYNSEEIVRMETLDRLFASNPGLGRNCLLKLDVQGYEDEVLLGGQELLKRIGGVKIELSIFPLYSGQVLHNELIKYLELRGFCLWNIQPGFSNEFSGRTFQYDAILIHNSLLKEGDND